MTVKQEIFVDNYCVNGFNATQAAKDANYAPHAKNRDNVCRQLGHKLVTNGNIRAEIDKKIAINQARVDYNYDKAIISLDGVIDNLRKQAKEGNVGANAALTAAIREKNAITGLHKQTILQVQEQATERTEAEQKLYADAGHMVKIGLSKGA